MRVVASVFGVLAGLLGIEHACEPALTFLPSYLASWLLGILLALGCLVWAVFFVRRSVGALVLLARRVRLRERVPVRCLHQAGASAGTPVVTAASPLVLLLILVVAVAEVLQHDPEGRHLRGRR